MPQVLVEYAVEALPENVLEDAAKSAFVKAQSVYRSDHDHFPLKSTWETATESVREGWRGIAYAALEAAYMPPLGTQPEPRKPRDVASAVAALAQAAAQPAAQGDVCVTPEMCDAAAGCLEIDYDGDEAYVRSDSIETALEAALSLHSGEAP